MWIFSLGTWPLGTCEAVGVPAGRFRGSLASGGTWVAEIPNQVWRSPAPCADKKFPTNTGTPSGDLRTDQSTDSVTAG